MIQAICFEYFKETKNSINLLCVKDDKEALLASDAIKLAGKKSYILPDLRVNFGDDLLPYSAEINELFAVLNSYYKDNSAKKILIAPICTILTPLPKKELFQTKIIEFASTINPQTLKEELYHWGYRVVDVVEAQGEASFRGDIVDIYPNNLDKPIRISLFDDEVESIREFECESQKSNKEELEKIEIFPAIFSLNELQYEKINQKIEYLQSDSFEKDIHSLGLWGLDELSDDYLKSFNIAFAKNMDDEIQEMSIFDESAEEKFKDIQILPIAKRYKPIEISSILKFFEFHKNKKKIILARNEVLLKQAGLDIKDVKFKQSQLIVNIMSDGEIIISLNKTVKKRRKRKATILLDELKNGDYVVHENYGIGIFKGLVNSTVLGSTRDFVQIIYQGDDKLLIPVENIEVIDRYIASSGSLAVIDKLGKGSFAKLKAKTREKLFAIAKEIIKTAAKREMIEALKINTNKEEIKKFQQDSGFIYTVDQETCIQEIFSDLQSGKIMDRLLSGDVGFGKTEVAMNAMFATAFSGFQTILIAPTTLLSSQHFVSLNERFKNYGIKVEKLDRFTSTKAKSRIIKELKEGSLKVCVGTHTLLDKEIKNPALIIIDEEHKFGVKQKEKLKNMRENIHILSMSATPIPRSLNMALSSIKQYSKLLTPPDEREDVRTFVKEYDEVVIKEAILREVRRGGQIFFVHNRIASIENKKNELSSMLPKLKILVLHSKVSPAISEKEIIKFQEGGYDMLLSTSIIESGIHIPNVNTIMIDGADNFGMADLHQLRGRVGRAKRQGFCYFLVQNRDKLSEAGKKRLIALESNSYLGSGSVLAYHDLEIRGGGNLIGDAQSGHIKHIGYSLYLKMLEDAISVLLNKTTIKRKSVDIKLSVNAYINSDYISEDRVRLEVYRRLSKCESLSDVLDIEEEMADRFGKIDEITAQFLQIINIKILATMQDIISISNYAQNITIKYSDDKKTMLKSRSKDDDDLIDTILRFLRKK
ncbi:MAG: transcription-repair coupling factor [Campylobacteraceae bacterium]|nr:transcription-repair coupling factor [Campylobacteraceae bacterium]